jgi:hypothetical protein
MNKPQTYNFKFVREWKIKKADWQSFMIFWFVNFVLQLCFLLMHGNDKLYIGIMVIMLLLFYTLYGKYPYLKKTNIILTKCDASRGLHDE